MSQIDDILERCLRDLDSGASTLDECLARHPEHAAQLEPLLRTASRVRMGGGVHPSPAFKARARANLTLHMQAHPRRERRSSFTFRRLAAGLAALLLALLVTGTVYAQGALPGDTLYDWKLVSEDAWRMVSSDSVNTDLHIANRRIKEMNATVNDPKRRAQALDGYREVRTRLATELDEDTLDSILPPIGAFERQQPFSTPTPTVGETVTPFTEDPEIVSTSAPNDNNEVPATKIPQIVPTIKVPPPIR